MCFKTYLNHPINRKMSQKKEPKAITVLKKEGGGGTVKQQVDITLKEEKNSKRNKISRKRPKRPPKRATMFPDGLEIKFYTILTF